MIQFILPFLLRNAKENHSILHLTPSNLFIGSLQWPHQSALF